MPVKVMKTPQTTAERNAYFEEFGRYHKDDPRAKKTSAMMGGGMTKKKTMMEHGGMAKKKTMMGHGGMGKYKKPEMAHGGMANKKKHMYAGGGSVMDNLTPGQKKMVMAMARDNKS